MEMNQNFLFLISLFNFKKENANTNLQSALAKVNLTEEDWQNITGVSIEGRTSIDIKKSINFNSQSQSSGIMVFRNLALQNKKRQKKK